MKKFPKLNEMGIDNPEEITKYTLSKVDDSDQLRVFYNREKYSLRPVSKRFVFGRFKNTMVVDSGSHDLEKVDEISPHLLKAITELDQITKSKKETKHQIQDLNEELVRLENELVSNLSSIRFLINTIENK